jgi:hypothetical protein
VSDGAGGAIFTWTDNRSLQQDVYAQRIDGKGEMQWQKNGIPICTACWPGNDCNNSKDYPQIISDGVGGGIIVWQEIRDGFHFSIWAQRVNAAGEVLWQDDGIPVANGDFGADFPKIVGNGKEGAIIIWQDDRNGVYRYYAQQIDQNGISQWPVNGIEIYSILAARGSRGFSINPDNYGGVIVAWVDGRTNESDIYAQRLNSKGEIQWDANGAPVCTRKGYQYSPKISVDNAGNTFIVWEDIGAAPAGSGEQWIYAQYVSGAGEMLWAVDGMAIFQRHSSNPEVLVDGKEGGIIVWDHVDNTDPSAVKPTILAQQVTQRGRMLWPKEGFEVYSQIGNYLFGPQIISDGDGGAIIHWTDYRNPGTAWDIYSQRIISEPVIGMPWMPLLLDD